MKARPRNNGIKTMTIFVRNNDIDKAMRILKKKLHKTVYRTLKRDTLDHPKTVKQVKLPNGFVLLFFNLQA